MGDLNCEPDSEEYALICGSVDPVFGPLSTCDGLTDAWVVGDNHMKDGTTYGFDDRPRRLDYILVTNDLVEHLDSIRVDHDAAGSDHKPVWAELDI